MGLLVLIHAYNFLVIKRYRNFMNKINTRMLEKYYKNGRVFSGF